MGLPLSLRFRADDCRIVKDDKDDKDDNDDNDDGDDGATWTS